VAIETRQSSVWQSDFGRDYTERNTLSAEEVNQTALRRYGKRREDLIKDWLAPVAKDARFLEIGSNIGLMLRALQAAGFTSLSGIEMQRNAVEKSKTTVSGVDIIQATAYDIPFKDAYFDVVFSNNVLIHIPPDKLPVVFDEMYRVSKKYIWGFEYFAPQVTEIPYRGQRDLLWKADYGRMFRERFPDLKIAREQVFNCLDEPGLQDKQYLLMKP
jgi:pseudaminic acid biosynthesis-associated methylase